MSCYAAFSGATVLAGAILLAAGCEARPPAEAAQRSVVRPVQNFAIDVPKNWMYRDLGGDVVLEIYKPEPATATATPSATAAATSATTSTATTGSAAASPTIGLEAAAPAVSRDSISGVVIHVVVIDRDRLGLKEWADQAIKDSREIQSDLEETARQETQLAPIAGEPARPALRVTLRSQRALEPLVQEMLLVQTPARNYAVMATGPQRLMMAARADIQACFDSLVVW